ncbi:uncharacterized protein C13orf42 [Fundulus heteroclitus]|uniref:uncharacterized protein C13orf42 n=1 Tax=Fundulus heteroclitus TaxID=8078 RepID=UPI00165C4B52|nr:uncharacterized protein C13orf42 [Fundulus heteroclitus]
MFRKLNNVFRPNHHGNRGRSDGGLQGDYHHACTVRLVRSTSMLVVGEKSRSSEGSTLKRSKSSVSIESTLYYYQRQEDRIWLYSQNQNCLEYLEALVALRRQYTKSVSDLKSNDAKATASPKKKPAPPPPRMEEPISRAKPSTPPVPTEEDTLEFFDEVIASCDSEPQRKPYRDDGHADVDFIVASSSAEHDLHSNWVLRVPRVADDSEQRAVPNCANESASNKKKKKKKSLTGSTSSRLQLQRNPIHLPKVVESAFQTLRFKPKLKKQ